METILARWESPRGAHRVEVYRSEAGHFGYRGNGCGGSLGNISQDEAIAAVQNLVTAGYFLPDSAKRPMVRR
jgi:hypothetical protein